MIRVAMEYDRGYKFCDLYTDDLYWFVIDFYMKNSSKFWDEVVI